jgi:hypothetical protein
MRTDREYPATHSMSTSWYIADEEGNVGIMNFDDCGPVPWETRECSFVELLFGLMDVDYEDENDIKVEGIGVSLTKEQLYDILGDPISVSEAFQENAVVVRIDPNKTKMFLEICSKEMCLDYGLSLQEGLYRFGPNMGGDSVMDKLLKNNIILEFYKDLDYLNDCDSTNRTGLHSLPYYIFEQPYWIFSLPECLSEPKHPVKIDQFPKLLKMRIPRLPIKFSETKSFQLAAWTPCRSHTICEATAYGCLYTLLGSAENQKAFFLQEALAPYDDEACYNSRTINYQMFCRYPTVISFHKKEEALEYGAYDELIAKSIHVQYLPFEYYCDESKKKLSRTNKACMRYYDDLEDKETFKETPKFVEYVVNRFKPHLITIDEEDLEVLGSVYPIKNHTIEVSGETYPLYTNVEAYAHFEDMLELANRPYRGVRYPMMVSIEEMRQIHPDLKLPEVD